MSEYLNVVFNPNTFSNLVSAAMDDLNSVDFDTIAFRGMSGAALAFPLAAIMSKKLLCVRKSQTSHSPYEVEGDFSGKKFIVLDDFIDTGETASRILDSIKDSIADATCVGIYLYSSNRGAPFFGRRILDNHRAAKISPNDITD